jgi:hypothetical protein
MLARAAQGVRLTLRCIFFLVVLCPSFSLGENLRKYPCDPKFGYEGNYLEIGTGDTADARDLLVCFGDDREKETISDPQWWQLYWEKIRGRSREKAEEKMKSCINLSSLPGRLRQGDGKWSAWREPLYLDRENSIFQFALCGSIEDPSVWEQFQRHLGVDSWDEMRLVALSERKIRIDRLRIVQNRVRILDNESRDEGNIQMAIQALSATDNAIDLTGRIRTTKLNRVDCLNFEYGPPYCEGSIPGLEKNDLSPVIITALMELGHSGSKKYGRENNAYCSEFSLYVIEKAVHLSETCSTLIPDPVRKDVNVKDMFKWFKMCERLIPREEIKDRIKPGDFLSVDNMGHGVIFLGWADAEKKYFWEISGNNRCRPERETLYAPDHKGNMVCIAKRDFSTHILTKDFGGVVED